MANLSTQESFDLLDRNSDARSRVLAHERLLQSPLNTPSGHWDQIEMAAWALPIPTSGYALTDSKYGNVVIFPDADGILHYVTTSAQVATEVNKARFESPGQTFEEILRGITSDAVNTGKTVVYLGVAVVAIWGLSVLKGR